MSPCERSGDPGVPASERVGGAAAAESPGSRFDPEYIRLVLDENFEDAKKLFLAPLMAIHYAHLVMLTERGIVSRSDARQIRCALGGIDLAAVRQARYDGHCEDLFFYVEGMVTTGCGADTAGHLHTARSRNDIDMTLYRLRIREEVLTLSESLLGARAVLINLAARHIRTIFPAHTHTQPAQPTTVAHYLLGAIEQFQRDTTRLHAAFRSINRNPLGACAITGTGFPIDRDRTSELLGFDGPTGNTYGSIAAADDVLESVAAAGVALTGLGRVLQDLLLWATREFGYLRLPDGFVQTSSVMPQKRNPVALEHARALASRALGQALAIPLAIHNTPFGDIVDTEDDLQPLVAGMFKDARRAVDLLAAAMREADFNVPLMRERATAGWVTVTELADTLARDYAMPFRAGHAIAAAVVREAGRDPGASLAALVTGAAAAHGKTITISEETLAHVLSPEHFVDVRRTAGGPSPDVVTGAIAAARDRLNTDRDTVTAIREALVRAQEKLTSAAQNL